MADTAATKFSMAQLEGHPLNYIGDSGSAGYHLIEDSYSDIVKNSSTIAWAKTTNRNKGLIVTDEIDTTKLADLKSKIGINMIRFDIQKIKDTAKNLIDN